MNGYDFFVRLNYSEILDGLPDHLTQLIVRCGSQHALEVNPAYLQMRPNNLERTGIDYQAIFENADMLSDEDSP